VTKNAGIRINVNDTTLHPDTIHRGGGQIIPTSRRVFYACQLKAEPRLFEPFFLVEITCPNEVTGAVYSCITQKRGEIDSEEAIDGTPITTIRAFLPVAESFGKHFYFITKFLDTFLHSKIFANND